jgi:hypothetical protein
MERCPENREKTRREAGFFVYGAKAGDHRCVGSEETKSERSSVKAPLLCAAWRHA